MVVLQAARPAALQHHSCGPRYHRTQEERDDMPQEDVSVQAAQEAGQLLEAQGVIVVQPRYGARR